MGQAGRKIENRKKAKKILTNLINDSEHVLVIHYSCERLDPPANGSSARITSIAVRNLYSGQTRSFSIHLMAEREKYPIAVIDEKYNDLEKLMLREFFGYVREHSGYKWLHWNMRDVSYGFQALAHRFQALGGKPVEIPEDKLFDLSKLLSEIYGNNYIGHQRLPNIIEKNNITKKDFLAGVDEVKAFENKEYVKLHLSTLRKVSAIASLVERVEDNTLITNAKPFEIYGDNIQAFVEWTQENTIAKLIALIITIVGLVSAIISFLK
ncbi:MAG: hypothetical protein WCK35_18860 [Chloroflexota bacterium]